MKDSWRAGIPDADRTVLVTGGIYAYSRNPAFLGFDLMYIGVLLMYCNLLTGMFTVFAIAMLHLQILQEERYLAAAFGEEYRAYRRQVLRYLGRRREKRNKGFDSKEKRNENRFHVHIAGCDCARGNGQPDRLRPFQYDHL